MFRLHHGRRTWSIAVPAGLCVTRHTLDHALVREAIAAGAHFLPETSAALVSEDGTDAHADCAALELKSRRGEARTTRGRVIVSASGLGHAGPSLGAGTRRLVAKRSRIGVGAVANAADVPAEPGVIAMAVARSGYVGIARAEASNVSIAAAFDPAFLKQGGSVGRHVAAALGGAGVDPPGVLEHLAWQGTLPLTQQTVPPVARRVLAIGDAASYVEPFTGEGMAWAIEAAVAAGPFIDRGRIAWTKALEADWTSVHWSTVGRRRRACRLATTTLRSPALTWLGMRLLERAPRLAQQLVRTFET
jgi:flavin-dependent dehydrogenase